MTAVNMSCWKKPQVKVWSLHKQYPFEPTVRQNVLAKCTSFSGEQVSRKQRISLSMLLTNTRTVLTWYRCGNEFVAITVQNDTVLYHFAIRQMYIEAYFLDKLTYGKSISYVFSQTLEACY